jgi:DNA polymerase
MLVGEHPGDQEDRRGAAFVGPAGRVLDEAVEGAAIKRSQVYLTNAVKHFKWRPAPRGQAPLRDPTGRKPWPAPPGSWAEVQIVRPRPIVCLGALAAETSSARAGA